MAAEKGSKYALGNDGGRPRLFESAEELIAEIDSYFIYIEGESHEVKHSITDPDGKTTEYKSTVWDRHPEPATITGLALFLGFCSRQSLFDYEKNDKFSYIIKKARLRVENEYEKKLDRDKPTGAVFALKNMGWSDRTDITTGGEKIESFNLGTAISNFMDNPKKKE